LDGDYYPGQTEAQGHDPEAGAAAVVAPWFVPEWVAAGGGGSGWLLAGNAAGKPPRPCGQVGGGCEQEYSDGPTKLHPTHSAVSRSNLQAAAGRGPPKSC